MRGLMNVYDFFLPAISRAIFPWVANAASIVLQNCAQLLKVKHVIYYRKNRLWKQHLRLNRQS